jgi:hypothetical protein
MAAGNSRWRPAARRRGPKIKTPSVIACDKREAFAQGSSCDEAIHRCSKKDSWIAWRSLSSGAHSRDPLARNDRASAARWRNPGKRVKPAPDFASAPSGLRDLSWTTSRIQLSNSKRTCVRVLAARSAPELCVDCPPSEKKRAQGKPGARCTRGPVCKNGSKKRTRAYRSAEALRLSLRSGLRLIPRSPR